MESELRWSKSSPLLQRVAFLVKFNNRFCGWLYYGQITICYFQLHLYSQNGKRYSDIENLCLIDGLYMTFIAEKEWEAIKGDRRLNNYHPNIKLTIEFL